MNSVFFPTFDAPIRDDNIIISTDIRYVLLYRFSISIYIFCVEIYKFVAKEF